MMGILGRCKYQPMRDESLSINAAIRLVAKTAPVALLHGREETYERNRYLKQNAVVRNHLLSLHINTEVIEDDGGDSLSYKISSLAVVWWGETLKEIEIETDSPQNAANLKRELSSRLQTYAEALGIQIKEFAIQETPWDRERGIGTWARIIPANAPMVRILKNDKNEDKSQSERVRRRIEEQQHGRELDGKLS
jgi:hypothetical protein